MRLKYTSFALPVLILWSIFSANTAQAEVCADIGGVCRPGWVSGCGGSEPFEPSGECPDHPSGELWCCLPSQSENECTAAGGMCVSGYYSSYYPSEPACGYGTGAIPIGASCSGYAMICCLPPPNVGDACDGGNGTCQMPANCSTGGFTTPACRGGTECCLLPPPALGYFSLNTCTIPSGESTCDTSASWDVTNPRNPEFFHDGVVISNAASVSGLAVILNYGSNTFILRDGAVLRSTTLSANCVTGTTWNGNICETFTPPPTCASRGGACEPGACTGSSYAVSPSDCSGGMTCCVTTTPEPPTCTSLGGICGSGVCTGTTISPSDCSGDTTCCVASTPIRCTGDATGRTGTCTLAGSCATTGDTSGICTSGEVCCVPSAGVGDVCKGGSGVCRVSCHPDLETPEPDAVCGGVMCCVARIIPPDPDTPDPPATPPDRISWTNPLKFNNIPDLMKALLGALQGLIVILALIMIVIGAFIYITSAGDEGRMTTAKNTILAALIGLAIGIAAPMFFREIATILGWGTPNLPDGVGTSLTLIQVASRVLNFLLSLVGIFALIMLIVGAFMYLTAAGDESRIDTGKGIVKFAVIGITVALAALTLLRQVAAFF